MDLSRLPFRPVLRLILRMVYMIERVLPHMLWPLAGTIVYCLLAFTPLFDWLGVAGHTLLLAGLGYTTYRWARRRNWRGFWPSLTATLAWLEERQGIAHHPTLSRRDRLSPWFARQASSSQLWDRHQQQMQQQLASLRPVYTVRWPRLPVSESRAMLGVLALSALLALFTGDGLRLVPAWQIPGWNAPLAWQGWIEPPAYTRLPPVALEASATNLSVPSGSRLLLQTEATRWPLSIQAGAEHYRLTRNVDGRWQLAAPLPDTSQLRLGRGLQTFGDWSVTMIADAPPQVHWPEPPTVTAQQTIALRIEAKDDYGVTELRLHVNPTLAAPDDAVPPLVRTLYANPSGVKSLSFVHIIDLTDHPLVGQTAVLSIEALDATGQSSRSDLMPLTLPERQFQNPVSQDIARVRRELRAKATAADEAAYQLFKHLNNPMVQQPQVRRDFLALSAAIARLRYSHDGTTPPGTLSLLWDIAISLDRQTSPLAQRQLDEAFKALQDALLNPEASPDELQALFAAYQQALMQYLMQQAAAAGATPSPPSSAQNLGSNDLTDWLKAIEEMQQLGQSGSALEQLQRLHAMMQNVQVAPPNPQAAALQQQMEAIGSILNQQNALKEQTRQQQDNPSALRELQAAQQGLQQQLQEALAKLNEQGLAPPEALAKAAEAMANATQALADGQGAPSLAAQQQAINQLQQGLQGMMQQMEAMGQNTLSLGGGGVPRPMPFGQQPEDITLPDIPQRQQAQDILDELRKRANESTRQGREREFLHRLLDLF